MAEAKPSKKRVGRPRKNPEKVQIPKNGVCSAPVDLDNWIEFVYDKPQIFKKLWGFLDQMDVKNIQVNYTQDTIYYWCKDHRDKNRIRVKIDCNKVSHYYCHKPLEICLLRDREELVMKTIDKSCGVIEFQSSMANCNRYINIILKDDMDVDKVHKIELVGNDNTLKPEEMQGFDDDDYAIKFKLPCKYFKKNIHCIRSLSEEATIMQEGRDGDLMFDYLDRTKKIKSTNYMRNKKKIELKSKIDPEDIFRVSFKVDDVKPISNSDLSDNIDINADENKPLKFEIPLDGGAITVTVLTKIVDERAYSNEI
jgi:hypothetical protein